MNVILRRYQKAHSGLIVKWRNENKQFFPEQPDLTLGSQYRWFATQYQDNPSDNYFLVLADGTPAGTIAYNSDTREIGRVLLGNKAFARQGVMSRALTLLIQASRTDLYRLKVLRNNEDAIAFYRKNYFVPFRNNYGPEGDGEWVWMERDMA